jgi:hypothetical protein
LQDPPKFTQIGIFGLKLFHLATLVLNWSRKGRHEKEPLNGKVKKAVTDF